MKRHAAGWALLVSSTLSALAQAAEPVPAASGSTAGAASAPIPAGPAPTSSAAPPAPPASTTTAAPPATTATSPAPEASASGAAPGGGTAASPPPSPSAPVAVPSVAAPSVAAPRPAPPAGSAAVVHLAVNYRDAWLETRSYVDGGDFVRTCKAPCDLKLQVDGLEARVTAPGMTSSNTFRFAPGIGAAGVRVDGGSATLRRIGIITLATGIPIAMIGMALFAHGKLEDRDGLKAGGIAGLALGGTSIGISLPLLLLGTTHVKSAQGSLIARALVPPVHH